MPRDDVGVVLQRRDHDLVAVRQERREAVGVANKVAPAAAGICILLGGVLFFTATKGAGIGAMSIGAILFLAIKLFALRITPR